MLLARRSRRRPVSSPGGAARPRRWPRLTRRHGAGLRRRRSDGRRRRRRPHVALRPGCCAPTPYRVHAARHRRRRARWPPGPARLPRAELRRTGTPTPAAPAVQRAGPRRSWPRWPWRCWPPTSGVLWVAIEATTIVTAFLVGHRRTRTALEAAWKYVVICSVGIAMALLGTVLLYYAAAARRRPAAQALDLDVLTAHAAGLDPGVTRHRGRAAAARLRHQSRPRPAARLAARRAQPGPRTGLRADVRGAALGRVLRHPRSSPSPTPPLGPVSCAPAAGRSRWPPCWSPRRC